MGPHYIHTRGRHSETHPVSGAEVDGLGEVVALVEAGVVAAREGDDELARVLIGANNLRSNRCARHERTTGAHTHAMMMSRRETVIN